MNKIYLSSILVITLILTKTPFANGQELFGVNNQPLNEELLNPVYHYEYIPDFTYDEVASKIKAMETDMPFELNDRIFSFINYFSVRNRNYTRMVLEREAIYFPLFEQVLAEYDMPDDIKFLAIIESGLNPKARSRVGAMGLWQFMPATGRMYQLYDDRDVDDRMDPELSTVAAAKYLKSLYRMFGDWELALAAYNCGPGNVRKAIRRSGGKNSFWEIYNYLPKETRGYVPQFQAIMYVMRHVEDHNLVLEIPTYPIAYDKVKFNQEIDLELLAQLTDTCIEDLESLNPSIKNRQLTSHRQNMAIRVPKVKSDFIAENKEVFKDAVKLSPERAIALRSNTMSGSGAVAVSNSSSNSTPAGQTRVTYIVKSGDVLGSIAQRHKTTVTNIKNWNNLNSNIIKVGQRLVIYTNAPVASQSLADNSSPSNTNDKTYIVQPGDSLWRISQKLNGVSVEQLKRLNNLDSNNIKPGQKLIIG